MDCITCEDTGAAAVTRWNGKGHFYVPCPNKCALTSSGEKLLWVRANSLEDVPPSHHHEVLVSGDIIYRPTDICAFQIREEASELTVIKFAKTPGEALDAAGEDDGIYVEFDPVTVEWKEEFDEFALLGSVPNKVLIDAGWTLPCDECSDGDVESTSGVVDEDGTLYCDECRQLQETR